LRLLFIGLSLHCVSCGGSGEIQRSPAQSAADGKKATPDNPERQALLKEFETPEIVECRDSGLFYDRRGESCLSELRTKGFPCNREEITQMLSSTGSQISQILDRSLGNPSTPGDKGEGFVIDQCGKSVSGRMRVDLIKKGPDGKLQIREVELKGGPKK
jgi:hypothetical protein